MDKDKAKEIHRLMMLGRWTIKEIAETLNVSEDSVRAVLAVPNEERIRTIVREELSNFLDKVGKKVEVPEYLETEKMEDAMVSIIQTIAEKEATEKVNTHEDYYDVH